MLKKFKNRFGILFVFIFIWFCISSANFTSFAEEAGESKIKMDFTYGYENFAKTGRYLPISMNFENEGEDFEGTVSFFLDNMNGDNYEYNYSISIAKGEEKQEKYTIFITDDIAKVNIKLSSYKGDTPAVGSIDFTTGKDNITLLIGTLSDTPGLLDYFDDVSINYGLLKTKTVALNTENFPKDSKELEQLDLLIISNYRIRDLSYEQSSALMDWVKSGGIMLLGTGFRVDDTLGRYAPELLDNMYENPELVDIDLNSVFEKYEQSYVQKLPIVNMSLHGGEVLFYQDNLPLLSAVNKEQGKIVVSAYDFINIYNYAKNKPEYVSSIIVAILGSKRMEEISAGVSGFRNSLHLSIQSIIGMGDAIKLPRIRLYTLLAIIYVIFIGPFLYMILRRNNLLYLYKKIVTATALIVSLAIFIAGSRTRFTGTFYNYVNILNVNESEIGQKTFINVRNPYINAYNIYVDPSYSITPLDSSLKYGQAVKGEPGIRINSNKDAPTYIKIYGGNPFEAHYFSLERRIENTDSLGIVSNIRLTKSGLSGKIINNYSHELKDALILFFGKVVVLGDLGVGESKDLSELQVYNIPITNYYEIASHITGIDKAENKDLNNKEYIELVKKTNMISFYMSNFIYGYTQDAGVLAFLPNLDDKYEPILNSGIKSGGTNIFTCTLNVGNMEDGEIYRQALLKTPTLISGEYYADINAIYTTEPAILEYHLGTDIYVGELIFEDLSEEFTKNIPKFKGRIYFYNIITEEYDRIDSSKKVFTSVELENYLTENNDIRIRYLYDNAEQRNLSVALPVISVVGRER